MRLRLIGLLAFLALLFGSPARAQSYTLTPLGSLPGYANSTATSVNSLGQVAGFAQNAPATPSRPFLYANETLQEVGSTGAEGQALGINSSEQIAGYYLEAGLSQPFLYVAPNVKHLGTLGGTEGAAFAVNEAGVVAGWSRLAGGARHAARFALDEEGNPRAPLDLGTLGGAESFAYGINLFGQVVGEAQTAGGQFRAFFYNGVMNELPTLGGSGGVAWAVNSGQQVVGASQVAGNAVMHAFLWHPTQGIRDLGTLGGSESHARAINNSGLVVGYSTLASGSNTHAFVWHQTSGMVDLNSLLPNGSGWELLEARGINDAGQIVGVGLFGGVRAAFLLTPPVADCSIALSTPQTSVAEYSQLTFTVTLTNHGPNGAPLGRAILSLPSGWPVNSVNIPGGTHSVQGSSVILNFGGLTNGQIVTAEVVTTAATPGNFVVTSSLQANKNDPDVTNNSAQVSLSVSDEPPLVDLRLLVEATPEPVGRNRNLSYHFMVTNFGPVAASGTNLVLSLPLAATFISAESSQGSLEFVPGNPPQQGEEQRNFVLGGLGIIGVGETVTGTIVIQYANSGTYNYILNVFSTDTDTHPEDNESSGSHTVVAPLSANLGLTGADSPDPALNGQNITYTFNVNNQGPDTATDVRLAVDLPGGVTVFSTSTPQGVAIETGGDVLFKLGNINNGATVQVSVVVTPGGTGTYNYSASVTTASDEAMTGNNSASGSTLVQAVANLGLTATDSPDPVFVGSDLTYTFDVTNAGPDAAPNARLLVDLPAGVEIRSASTPQGSATTLMNGDVRFDFGSVANGANLRATVVVRPQSEGALAYSATVSSDAQDSSMGNNTRAGSTLARLQANLGLTVTDSPDPVLVDQQLTYTLTVANAGPHTAKNVRLTLDLAPGVQIVSRNAPQGTSAVVGGDVVFTLGDLANGATVPCTVVVTSSQEGTLPYSATVVTDSVDPESANNTRSGNTGVNAGVVQANLGLTATDGPDPVNVGSQLTYTFVVTNAGPDEGRDVRLEVDLPEGVSFVSANATKGSGTLVGGDVAFTFGNLANGEGVTATVVVTPLQAGTLAYSAVLETSSEDTDMTDNTRSGTTAVNPAPLVADLGVTATDGPDPLVVGGEITYTFTVTNHGPDPASGVVLNIDLPAGVQLVSASAPGVQFSQVDGNLLCTIGAMANAASVPITVKVTATAEGAQAYSATVTTTATDNNSANNTVDGSTTVQPEPVADLTVNVTDTPDPVDTGKTLTYTYTVANAGPETTSGTFQATLPAGVTLLSVVSTSGEVTVGGNGVTCTFTGLANGSSFTVTVRVEVNTPGTKTATGQVQGTLDDPNETNNSATATTTVNAVARPDLTGTWTVQPTQKGKKFKRTRMRYTVKGTFTVQNVGTANSKKTFVTFYLSDDAVLDAGDKQLRRVTVAPLRPGRGLKKAVTTVMPVDESAAGKYLIAVVDSAAKAEENSEANNTVASATIPE